MTISTVPSEPDVNSTDISPQIGITGTPAIDASTGYLYVVGTTKDVYSNDTADPHYVLALYKVNIASGLYSFAVIADTTYASNGSYYYFPGQSGNDANGQYNTGPYVIGTGRHDNGAGKPLNEMAQDSFVPSLGIRQIAWWQIATPHRFGQRIDKHAGGG